MSGFKQTVCQCGFAVVDVRYNAEISDTLLGHIGSIGAEA
jgi:hypothetical protein